MQLSQEYINKISEWTVNVLRRSLDDLMHRRKGSLDNPKTQPKVLIFQRQNT